jgi:hypothetical protein
MEPTPSPEGGAPGHSAPSLPSDTAARKRVHFAPEAKKDDGPPKPNTLFGTMMRYVFRDRRAPLVPGDDVVRVLALNGDLKMLAMMMLMLLDLIARCEKNKTNPTLVLPRGGGSVNMVTSAHLPYMRKYVQYIEKVIKAVVSRQASQSGGGGK